MFEIRVIASAYKELRYFAEWFEDKKTGYGRLFIDEYLEAVQHIKEYPFAQQEIEDSLRQLMIGRFPCLIIYDVIDNKTVAIYRIIHAHTHPAQKRRKA